MISGYFSLVRTNREDEVKRTTRSFLNILQKYTFWTIVFVIANNFINGGSITASLIQDLFTSFFNPALWTVSAIGSIFAQGKFLVQTAPLWYLFTFMGFILMSPLLKAFLAKSDIKLVRFVMVVTFVGAFVWPNLITIAKTMFADNAAINGIFGQSSLFDLNRFSYSLIFYYMLGGWLNLETGYKKFIEKTNMIVLTIFLIIGLVLAMGHTLYISPLFVMNPTVSSGAAILGSGYEGLLLLPAALVFFMFFNKLDEKLNEEGGLGRFVKQHSSKTLGVYITHVFVIGIVHNLVGFANINAFLTGFDSNILTSIMHFAFAIVIFIISFILVSILRKTPVLKRFV